MFEMSDEAGSAPATASNVRNNGPSLYSASGERLRASGQQVQNQTDQLAEFVQQQPLTAALAALIIGYFLGKIS